MSAWENREKIAAFWKQHALSAALETLQAEQLDRLQEPFRSLAIWLDACNAEIIHTNTLFQAKIPSTRPAEDDGTVLTPKEMFRILKREADPCGENVDESEDSDEWDEEYSEDGDDGADCESEIVDASTAVAAADVSESANTDRKIQKSKFQTAYSQEEDYLRKLMLWTYTQKMSTEQWIQHPDLIAFCEVVWGKDAPLLLRMLSYRMEGVFQQEYSRRELRCRQSVLPYMSSLFEILQQMNKLRFHHLTLDSLLQLWQTNSEEYFQLSEYDSIFAIYMLSADFLPVLLAVRLDDGDPKVLQAIRPAIEIKRGRSENSRHTEPRIPHGSRNSPRRRQKFSPSI